VYAVGVVEIVAGLVVAIAPRFGRRLVAAWLAGIYELLTLSGFYDGAAGLRAPRRYCSPGSALRAYA
jgi:hypothetical protein